MRYSGLMVFVLAGAVFGSATSLSNNLSSEYGTLGMGIAGSPLSLVMGVSSNLIGHGWSWAAFAVLVGCTVRSLPRAASGATLALISGTVGYYLTDSVTVYDPLRFLTWSDTFSSGETAFWVLASLLFGPLLGVLGSGMRRSGIVGMTSGLILAAGSASGTYMILSDHLAAQREANIPPAPELWIASLLVWTASSIFALYLVYRYFLEKRTQVS